MKLWGGGMICEKGSFQARSERERELQMYSTEW